MSAPTDLGYGRRGHALLLMVPAVVGAALIAGSWALLSMRARTLKEGRSAEAKDLRDRRGSDQPIAP